MNEWLIEERWIGNDLEGSGRNLSEVLSRNLPGGTEEYHEEPQSVEQASLRRFTGAATEHRSRTLQIWRPLGVSLSAARVLLFILFVIVIVIIIIFEQKVLQKNEFFFRVKFFVNKFEDSQNL
jgi:hypothetical protein